MFRPLAIACVAALALFSTTAHAQSGPLGSHGAPGTNASGHAADLFVGGQLAASVPLDLPIARGGIPLPLRVVYDGSNRVGEAGVGWSIPLDYIALSDGISRRKPIMKAGATSDSSAERIFVQLGGRSALLSMRTAGVYRGFVEEEYLEVTGPFSGAGSMPEWRASDLAGRTYTFRRQPDLGDDDLWLLAKIADATTENTVELSYAVTEATGSSPAEIRLTDIRASFIQTAPLKRCPKYHVALTYGSPFSGAPAVLDYSVDRGRLRKRTAVVTAIEVLAAVTVCDEHTARRYDFQYAPDADTGRPRLTGVDAWGLGGEVPGSPELAEPIARYRYGTATNAGELTFLAWSSVDLPAGVPAANAMSTTLTTDGGKRVQTRQLFSDLTGDGVPDLVHPGATPTGPLHLARGRVSAAGQSLDPGVPLYGAVTGPSALAHTQTTELWYKSVSDETNVGNTWTALVDWNGDGRLDIVDVEGGVDFDHWRLLLNQASAGSPLPSWQERQVNVYGLRAHLEALGHLIETDRLPVSRTQSAIWIRDGECWQAGEGVCFEGVCTFDAWPCAELWEGRIWRPTTVTEWKLQDINGDGFVDFVFNEVPVQATESDWGEPMEYPGPTCPNSWTTQNGLCVDGPCPDPECSVLRGYERKLDIDDNRILVIHNVNGGGLASTGTPLEFAGHPRLVMDNADCGVERWWTNAQHEVELCGFLEANGDGIADYVRNANWDEQAGWNGPWSIALGTGEVDGFEGTPRIPLPGHPRQIDNERPEDCCVTGAIDYAVEQVAGLVDLTGDGILDYVNGSNARIGTGVGFAPAIPIVSEGHAFALSSSEETCQDEFNPRTSAGLLDTDGDGRADLVRSEASGKLAIGKIVGNSGLPGAHDAGRLTGVTNGYGALHEIRYDSAKKDSPEGHQVSFPEIVVRQRETILLKELGTSVAPVTYAYDGAAVRYDPLLARWTFPGYGRRVVLRGLSGPLGIRGTATVYDAIGTTEVAAGYSSLALAGRVRDVRRLEGIFDSASSLLPVVFSPQGDPAGGAPWKWRANTHYGHAVRELEIAGGTPPPECYDVTPFTAAPAPGPASPKLCQRAGIAFVEETTSWEGEGPASGQSVWTKTIVTLDDWGRASEVEHQNDMARTDDDVCVETEFAGGASGVRDLPRTSRVTDCFGARFSGVRYEYDDQPPGTFTTGLVTATTIERYEPATWTLLDEHLATTAHHDEYGNVVTSTRYRPYDGTDLKTTIAYDLFGVVPIHSEQSASDVTLELQESAEYDHVRLLPLTVTDANGVARVYEYDAFGRRTRELVSEPGSGSRVLSETAYLLDTAEGDAVGPGDDTKGRRIRHRTYHEWHPAADPPDPSRYLEATILYDELARPRKTLRSLGADYGDRMMVDGDTSYDALGRVSFVADTYPMADPAPRYGTTSTYDPGSRPLCTVRGSGPQVFTSTDPSKDRFATCHVYLWSGSEAVVRTFSPSDLVPPLDVTTGAYDEVRSSAIGWRLEWSRAQGGVTQERSRATYDRLGQLVKLQRAVEPTGGVVVWLSWAFKVDSLGRTFSLAAPGAATKTQTFDEWGNVREVSWVDGGVTRGTQSSFDAFGRVTEIATLPPDPDKVESFGYDTPSPDHVAPTFLAGRLARVSVGGVTTFLGYDLLGRPISHARVNELTGVTYADQTDRRPSGQVSTLRLIAPDVDEPEAATYEYDSASRVRLVSWSGADASSVLFDTVSIDDFGRHLEATLGNGAVERRAFRPGARREMTARSVVYPDGVERITGFDGFDGEGRLTGRSDGMLACAGCSYAPAATTYEYNILRQLESATTKIGPALVREESYLYDALGNVRHRTRLGAGTTDFTVHPTDPDRVVAAVPPSGPATTLSYDALGDVEAIATGADVRTFQRDERRRLVEVTRGAGSATLRWGAFDELVELDVVDPSTGVDRHELRFGPYLRTIESSGETLVERSVPLPMGALAVRVGIGAKVEVSFRHAARDGHWLTTDQDGAAAQEMMYTPYGEILQDTGDGEAATYSHAQFNGGDALAPFGITRLGPRVYDAELARFLERDPILVPATATRTNPYAFSFGDPINHGDPSGMYPEVVDGGSGSVTVSSGGTPVPPAGPATEEVAPDPSAYRRGYSMSRGFEHPDRAERAPVTGGAFVGARAEAFVAKPSKKRIPIGALVGGTKSTGKPWHGQASFEGFDDRQILELTGAISEAARDIDRAYRAGHITAEQRDTWIQNIANVRYRYDASFSGPGGSAGTTFRASPSDPRITTIYSGAFSGVGCFDLTRLVGHEGGHAVWGDHPNLAGEIAGEVTSLLDPGSILGLQQAIDPVNYYADRFTGGSCVSIEGAASLVQSASGL